MPATMNPEGLPVAELDQLQAELRASEARYRALVEQAPDAVLTAELTGRVVSANPAALATDRMLEALRAETERLDMLQTVAVAANGSKTLSQALRRCLPILCKAGGWTVGHVYRPHLRGWHQLVATAIWYHDGDVSAPEFRKESRAAVVVPGRGLVGRALASGGPEWAADLRTVPGFVRARAALRDGLVSGLALPVLSNGELVAALELYSTELRERDEDFLRLLAHACAILGPVADRQQSRLALARARRESDDLIRSLPCALVAIDGDGFISHCNEFAMKLLGWQRNGWRSSYLELPFPPALEALRSSISRCLAEQTRLTLSPIRIEQRGGGQLFLDISLRSLPARGGAAPGVLLVATDVSEIERMQTSFATSQRLESIGQLAGGIAHELNTPMQYVGDNLQFLDQGFADLVRVVEKGVAGAPDVDLGFLLEEIPKALSDSREGVEQVAHIVRAMKELSDRDSGAGVPTDLNELVQSVLTVSRNVWKFLADVELDLCATLPPVPCHPGPLSRALANLIVNAAEAIAEVARASGTRGSIRIRTLQDGAWAELRIADTGPGIPQPLRKRVFDPFFSTKSNGTATGQGLALTQSVIVDGHGGTLRFTTAVGRGTTFFVRLPLAPAGEDRVAAA